MMTLGVNLCQRSMTKSCHPNMNQSAYHRLRHTKYLSRTQIDGLYIYMFAVSLQINNKTAHLKWRQKQNRKSSGYGKRTTNWNTNVIIHSTIVQMTIKKHTQRPKERHLSIVLLNYNIIIELYNPIVSITVVKGNKRNIAISLPLDRPQFSVYETLMHESFFLLAAASLSHIQ